MTRKEEIEQAAENYYNEVKYLSDLSAFPIAAFKTGAKWADKTMLDKVCEWLKENTPKYYWYNNVKGTQGVRWFDMVEDLRKAMGG